MTRNRLIEGLNENAAAWMHNESKRTVESLSEATITAGVIRWNSNNRVPPEDIVELANHVGLPVNIEKCNAARNEENAKFFAAYRAARANGPTDEERMEARAAMGANVEMVDVITGYKWRT